MRWRNKYSLHIFSVICSHVFVIFVFWNNKLMRLVAFSVFQSSSLWSFGASIGLQSILWYSRKSEVNRHLCKDNLFLSFCSFLFFLSFFLPSLSSSFPTFLEALLPCYRTLLNSDCGCHCWYCFCFCYGFSWFRVGVFVSVVVDLYFIVIHGTTRIKNKFPVLNCGFNQFCKWEN